MGVKNVRDKGTWTSRHTSVIRAIRRHLSVLLAAVKLRKIRGRLPVNPKEKQIKKFLTSKWAGRSPMDLELYDDDLKL